MGSIRRLLTFTVLLLAAGCTQDLEALDLPWPTDPAGPGKAPLAPLAEDGRGERGGRGRRAPAQQVEAPDCDVLPLLTPEEISKLPGAGPGLSRGAPQGPPPRYATLGDVELTDRVASRVAQLDAAFARRTRKHLTVTSGTRDAGRQARAMYKMLRLGADVLRLYRNKEAVREIKEVYDAGRAAGKPADDIVAAMYAVLRAQIDRGVYISAHLRAGAVDIRNRDMSDADKKAFTAAAAEVGGMYVLEESAPPHFHLQID